MWDEMTFARYAQLALILVAVAATAFYPSLAGSVLVLSVLTGALAGSAMTSGGLGGTVGGAIAGVAFGAYVASELASHAPA